MKIKKIFIEKVDLGTTRPYSIANKTVDSVDNVIVRIELENGIVGWGAANPCAQVVGQDVNACYADLCQNADAYLLGADIRRFGSLMDILETGFHNKPGSRAALDIALHDAWAKFLGVPLVALFGQKTDSMPTSITIGIKSPDETLKEADEYFAMGFRYLKVKLGKDVAEDLEKLFKLRERFKNSIHIRVDANQGYTGNEFLDFFEKARPLQLELIEQPLTAKNADSFSGLTIEVRTVIAADESLLDCADAIRLTASNSCGIFNIKLMKSGGIDVARKIGFIAQLSGVELMWGCNDESVISIAAALHTAFSCRNTRYLDLDGSFDLARDVARGGFLVENGVMRLAAGPGLGIEPL